MAERKATLLALPAQGHGRAAIKGMAQAMRYRTVLDVMLGSDLAPCLHPFMTRVRSVSCPNGTGYQTRLG